jgi:hypothetical protein
MTSLFSFKKWLGLFCLTMALTTICQSAFALDSYQDRRGVFWGIGIGGGGAFPISNDDPGGAVLFDIQIGGGANKNLTLSLDLDFSFQLLEDHKNFFITPGPELNYFFGETGLFIRAGLGMALNFVFIDEDKSAQVPGEGLDDSDFRIGFDGSLGIGWEFFTNSNLAVGIAAEGDYVVIEGIDIAVVGFLLSLKHY